MNNYGFRINKYLKISLIIGIIDLLTFYIIGKIFDYLQVFNAIMSNWKYISLFIASILLIVYFIDIFIFYDRKRKYRFLLIFKEPFRVWSNYIYKNNKINKKHLKCNFYYDIYYKEKNEEKIKAIMEDEILIRDVCIHVLLTNTIIVSTFFCLQNYNEKILLYCLIMFLIIYVLINLLYRNYLKYYINEIYTEYLSKNS